MISPIVDKYFREDFLPHIWCAGCSNGIVIHDIAMAIDKIGLDKDKVCIVSGIGCSSRAPGYMDFNTIHTTHGRALPVATGIKMARPDMTVVVITGDGDCVAIGGNHFIHAARRNIDLTIVVFNNSIYGMTGGQYSPTTPTGEFGTTAPYGVIDQDFDICRLAEASGASYVARGTAYHTRQTIGFIEEGIRHCGTAVIDVASTCPTYYGRKNKKGNAVQMLEWQRDNTIRLEKAKTMTEEERTGKIVMGVFHKEEKPEFCQRYSELVERAQKGGK